MAVAVSPTAAWQEAGDRELPKSVPVPEEWLQAQTMTVRLGAISSWPSEAEWQPANAGVVPEEGFSPEGGSHCVPLCVQDGQNLFGATSTAAAWQEEGDRGRA